MLGAFHLRALLLSGYINVGIHYGSVFEFGAGESTLYKNFVQYMVFTCDETTLSPNRAMISIDASQNATLTSLLVAVVR